MSLAIVHSRAQVGIEAPAVTVEAHLANGLPSLALWGCRKRPLKRARTACAAPSSTAPSTSPPGVSNVVNTFFALMNKVPH